MKPQVEDTSQEPFLWTWNQEPWTQSEQDPSVNSSDQTTSSSDNLEQETTGLKAITQKALNSSTQFLMSLEKKQKAAIASRAFKSPTP